MSLVSQLKWGVTSYFDSKKRYGFVKMADGKVFFHAKGYRDVNVATDEIQNEPWLSNSRRPRDPMEGDVLVFWLGDDKVDRTPKRPYECPTAGEWTFANIWNPALVESLERKKAGWSKADIISEVELLCGL